MTTENEENMFVPVHERTLKFQEKEIITADLADGNGYVSVRSLCEAFGLDGRAQRRRLQRQQGYFEPYTATIQMQTAGGKQATLCLMASAVPLFLTGVAEQETYEENLEKKVEAELAELRRVHDEKVQQIRDAFGDLRQQVTLLEKVAGPKARLTPEQMGQLRQTIATLGSLMQERGIAKPYPGIYMDVTRLTGVSRSEDIRQDDFPKVIEFLNRQVKALTQSQPPDSDQPKGN
jgi:hypothetical protein